MLAVDSVPSIAIVDREGKLRLSNGASLKQTLGYKVNLEAAIRRVAETGTLMTYGMLERYFPVKELEGQACPDFAAPLLSDTAERRMHGLLERDKLNVLIFWSVNCPHCRKTLPDINAWLKEHPGAVNIVSAADVPDESTRTKTLEFCRLNGLGFPVFVDKAAEISSLYKVTTTPTILIIGPDGVVDTAITSGYADFGHYIEERREKLRSVGATEG
jgi:thiol-disulfide isomerase/thioredoxin